MAARLVISSKLGARRRRRACIRRVADACMSCLTGVAVAIEAIIKGRRRPRRHSGLKRIALSVLILPSAWLSRQPDIVVVSAEEPASIYKRRGEKAKLSMAKCTAILRPNHARLSACVAALLSFVIARDVSLVGIDN